MKISDLKKEAIQKSNVVSDDMGVDYGVEIGTFNYTIRYEYITCTFKRLNRGEFSNHQYILVESNVWKTYPFDTKEKEFFTRQIEIMKEYWLNYYQLKGIDGAIFVGDILNEDLPKIIADVMNFHQLDKQHVALIDGINKRFVFYGEDYQVLGACLSDELLFNLEKFRSAAQLVQEELQKNKLLVEGKNSLEDLYYNHYTYQYCGEKLIILLADDFQTFHIKRCKLGTSDFIKEISIPATAEELNRVLKEIKEENELKNLIQPPRPNFDALIKRIVVFCDDKMLQLHFDNMVDYFGSWEKAEEISADAFRLVENRHFDLIINIENEKVSRRQLQGYRIPVDGIYLFVFRCSYFRNQDFIDDFHLIISTESLPMDVKDFIGDYLTKHIIY